MSEFEQCSPDIAQYRKDFPILQQTVHDQPMVYLDTAATAQKPRCVMEAMTQYYEHDHANVHRGVYELSRRATAEFESARQTIRHFIGASENHEIVFTKGATEAINCVAYSYGEQVVQAGDEILLTEMEHHANIVPWVLLAKKRGARIRVLPLREQAYFDLDEYRAMLSDKTKIVGLIHSSNVLGIEVPVKQMVALAQQVGASVLVDMTQAVVHGPVDVADINCDFAVFSGHKLYGPTGTGCLYAKTKHLQRMQPYQSGGDMIRTVTFEDITYNAIPYKFEAGTANIAGFVGLARAIDYLNEIGWSLIQAHEQALLSRLKERLRHIEGLRLLAPNVTHHGVLSFVMQRVHPHDIGTLLDQQGIAIRVGHHCAMPLMQAMGVAATARVSVGLYNNERDIDRLIAGLRYVNEVFGA